ncbi:MAG TPA: low molecular weight protein-tyrosine-phosphatase [Thermoleophilaceae bacterium]|nr:low molecular weight protein-tyrosine-phosphatase [Thermoleophilaceae bacterium]
MRLLFVCLGNICRSPTAEGVMRHLLAEEGLVEAVEIDSAGTGDWHVGHAPDHRSTGAAAGRGIELTGQARQVTAKDFDSYDLILAMDRSNHEDLLALAPNEDARERVRLLREYDPEAVAAGELEVPDPYYGDGDGFEDVLDLVSRACEGLTEAEVRPRVA